MTKKRTKKPATPRNRYLLLAAAAVALLLLATAAAWMLWPEASATLLESESRNYEVQGTPLSVREENVTPYRTGDEPALIINLDIKDEAGLPVVASVSFGDEDLGEFSAGKIKLPAEVNDIPLVILADGYLAHSMFLAYGPLDAEYTQDLKTVMKPLPKHHVQVIITPIDESTQSLITSATVTINDEQLKPGQYTWSTSTTKMSGDKITVVVEAEGYETSHTEMTIYTKQDQTYPLRVQMKSNKPEVY